MRKKVLTLFAIVCCLVMALGVFVACNDGDGTGGDGAGDSIFNEGASLVDIITALENAESLTYTVEYKLDGTVPEGAYRHESSAQYKVDGSAVLCEYSSINKISEYESTSSVNEYAWRSNGVDYLVYTSIESENGVTDEDLSVEKDLEQLEENRYEGYIYDVGAAVIAQYLMTDADGNIVVNTDAFSLEYYVEGSAYVKFNGSNIEIGYNEEDSDENGTETTSYKITLSGVNATTVEIPDEVRSLEAEAEWSDYVSYNGVSYRKMTDADGSEYYVVDYNPDGVPIEETINTLPVRQ